MDDIEKVVSTIRFIEVPDCCASCKHFVCYDEKTLWCYFGDLRLDSIFSICDYFENDI